jgi:hypothetical protein
MQPLNSPSFCRLRCVSVCRVCAATKIKRGSLVTDGMMTNARCILTELTNAGALVRARLPKVDVNITESTANHYSCSLNDEVSLLSLCCIICCRSSQH